MQFERRYIAADEAIASARALFRDPVDASHIEAMPHGWRGDFWRRERTRHDGTLVFSLEAIAKLFLPLITQESYYRKDPATFYNCLGMRYQVSQVRHSIIYGVKVNDIVTNGMRESFRITVRAIPVYCDCHNEKPAPIARDGLPHAPWDARGPLGVP